MKCNQSRQLADYQAGNLPAAAQERMRAHVSGCGHCARELAALEATARCLRPMPLHDAPPESWAQIQARLKPRHARGLTRRWAPAFAAALVLVVILAVVFLPMLRPAGPALPQVAESGGYVQVQLAAAWDTPLADKAALGLAMMAVDDGSGRSEALD